MTQWAQNELAIQSYKSRSLTASAQRLVNLYPEINPEGAKAPVTLLPTPGLKPWTEVGDGPIRGLRVMGAYLYVVSGEELYRVGTNKVSELLGTIAGTGPCYMTENGQHVGIAAQHLLYAASASGVLPLPQTGMVGATYQDGYGIFAQGSTQKFWLTGLDDMTSMSALAFSTADALSDLIMGCMSDHRQLWLFKQKSIEVWYNAGTSGSVPFARDQSGFIERGCSASGSIAKTEHHLFWLGDDHAVYMSEGYTARRISTPAMERLIAGQDASSAVGFTYSQEGHTFYVLTFASLTISFDLLTGKWHERVSPGESRWRANHHEAFAGTEIVGDFETGDLYELDLETYTDDDDARDYIIESTTIHAGGKRAVMDEYWLDCEMGIGTEEDDESSDPSAFLSVSDDGGKTWSTPREAELGQLGEYSRRATWTRLGTFYQRVVRIHVQERVKFAVSGTYARMEAWQ